MHSRKIIGLLVAAVTFNSMITVTEAQVGGGIKSKFYKYAALALLGAGIRGSGIGKGMGQKIVKMVTGQKDNAGESSKQSNKYAPPPLAFGGGHPALGGFGMGAGLGAGMQGAGMSNLGAAYGNYGGMGGLGGGFGDMSMASMGMGAYASPFDGNLASAGLGSSMTGLGSSMTGLGSSMNGLGSSMTGFDGLGGLGGGYGDLAGYGGHNLGGFNYGNGI